MKFILLISCCLFGFSASAQWYRVDLKLKKHPRFPLIDIPADNSMARVRAQTSIKPVKIRLIILDRSEYSFQAAENVVMRSAQHNMRFRVYNDASYNFSELAKLYIQQNRYSEAKWYLLQSNIISRQQNDDKHTIANLIDLATIKSDLGDFQQAQQDLTEALELANVRCLKEELTAIDKKMAYVRLNKNNAPKTDVRYAEVPVTKADVKHKEPADKSQGAL